MAKDLWIPNPLAQQLIFYNNILTEIYGTCCEIMAPLQIKDYVTSQRIARWKIERGDSPEAKSSKCLKPREQIQSQKGRKSPQGKIHENQ